jgi:hypothetical protein
VSKCVSGRVWYEMLIMAYIAWRLALEDVPHRHHHDHHDETVHTCIAGEVVD